MWLAAVGPPMGPRDSAAASDLECKPFVYLHTLGDRLFGPTKLRQRRTVIHRVKVLLRPCSPLLGLLGPIWGLLGPIRGFDGSSFWRAPSNLVL